MKRSEAEILFRHHLRELGFCYQAEAQFHATRKWRLDFVLYADNGATLKSTWVAVEIEGGIWTRGRHSRGKGYENDMRKYNAATMMGYRVLRFSTSQVLRGEARAFLKEHLVNEIRGGTR